MGAQGLESSQQQLRRDVVNEVEERLKEDAALKIQSFRRSQLARRTSNISRDKSLSQYNGMEDEELATVTQRMRNEVAEMRQLQARQKEEVGRLNQLISIGKRGTTQRCHECDVNLVDLSALTQ